MVAAYRLMPINSDHESWKRSKIKPQAVTFFAYDCVDARLKVAAMTTENVEGAECLSPKERHAQIASPKSPWELPDVTSCELHDSATLMHANRIVLENGSQWP
jgi:hypothetical protein